MSEQGDIIKAIWEAASELGLTSRWQFWAVVAAVFAIVVLRKLGFFPYVPTDPEGFPTSTPKAPHIDIPEGGAPLDQKPKGPDDWNG